MSLLLLAACGKAGGQSAPTSSAKLTGADVTGATVTGTAPAVDPLTTRAQVTVPGLQTSPAASSRAAASPVATSSSAKTLIPLHPVTHSSAPASTTASQASAPPPPPPSTTTVTTPPATSTTSAASTSATTTSSRRRVATGGLAGKVVAIDPGHNGANAEHPEIINQLIDGGYGQRNACNTTGTQTDNGYPEYRFTWNVANYLKPLLQAAGITVVMTRATDTGVGPCTDKRAALENNADADAVVSIHGDGAPPSVRGFYVLTAARPPAGSAIAAASLRLASCIAAAAVDAGFPPSNSLGSGGLWTRDDLTGLNRSTRPKILIECGNMRNGVEAGLMSSTDGQQRYAKALAQGVFTFLKG